MLKFDSYNFAGKKALVRVDFNVPLDDNKKVTDDTRIRASLPTIKKILNDGGSVILMSHLGRPKGKVDMNFSLKPAADKLSELLDGKQVIMADDCVGDDACEKAKALKPGEILLLENLRFHSEEEAGDEKFSKCLADLGDVYVNDAFGTAHRAHASTTIVAKFFPKEKLFGYLMEEEIEHLNKVLKSNEKPFTAIIGGAKVSDKVGIIENLIQKADYILIGGAMAYTFIKAQDGKTGKSLVEEDKLSLAKHLLDEARARGVKIMLPQDSVIATEFNKDATPSISQSNEIPNNMMGLDIGPEAIKAYKTILLKSKTILWNGPMGVFEWDNFANGTKDIAHAVADATTQNGAYSLIGGGDSVAAIHKFNLADKVSYISTGGGAMLEYLEGITLPGIKAVLN